jgi:hypothetical protein
MSASEVVPSFDLRARERHLAKEIVSCDPAIQRVILLDENGEIMDVERSDGSTVESLDPNELKNLGALDAIVIGAAKKAPVGVGKPEFALYVFGEAEVLLMSLPSVKRMLAIRIQRSSNTEYLYRKIRDRFEPQ